MKLKLNPEAFEYARYLISQGNVNCQQENWHANKPTPEQEDLYLQDHSLHDYGNWFLAINTIEDDNTKKHFEFPIGNFKDIYRSGIIAAKERAARYKHFDIEQAAAKLLDIIDAGACKK